MSDLKRRFYLLFIIFLSNHSLSMLLRTLKYHDGLPRGQCALPGGSRPEDKKIDTKRKKIKKNRLPHQTFSFFFENKIFFSLVRLTD